MHIAVVSNTCWYLFNFRLNLMLALQAAGHTVIAVAPEDAYTQRVAEFVRRDADSTADSAALRAYQKGASQKPSRRAWMRPSKS